MNQIDLKVEPRKTQSKNENRRMRRDSRIPAVVYGRGADPVSVAVDAVEFSKLSGGGKIHASTVFNLDVAGSADQAIIRTIQRDPVSERPVHIDFWRISPDVPIDVKIPVHATGVARGVKLGGILETVTRHIRIRVLPLRVPEYLEISVADMGLGHSLHVSDLTIPEGVTLVTPGHETLFIVQVPRGMQAEEKGEGAAPAAAAAPAGKAPAGKAAPAGGKAPAGKAPAAKAPAAKAPAKGK